jgi:hypothetical protein
VSPTPGQALLVGVFILFCWLGYIYAEYGMDVFLMNLAATAICFAVPQIIYLVFRK